MTKLCKCGMEWTYDDGSDTIVHCDDCMECRGEIAANDAPLCSEYDNDCKD